MALFGLLNVNKPAGPTSRDAVNRVERLVRPAKAGHAGTLDPLATGVLVICVGQATRLIQYVQQMPKTYHGTFLLGQRSESDDIERPVEMLENPVVPSRTDIEKVLPRFLGQIQQRPPAHSAVSVGGRRAYEFARKGKPVDLAERPVTIHQFTIRRYEYPTLELDIKCGSGTYVRSLGRDLAAALGTAAVMSALARTAIGSFRVEDAISMDALTLDEVHRVIQPALTAVLDLERITLTEADLAEIRHGRPLLQRTGANPPASNQEWAAINPAGELAAILYEKRTGELWPAMNLG